MYSRSQDVHNIVEQRRMILGPDDRIRGLSLVKYEWAREMWLIMKANNWVPEEISLSRDKEQYTKLPPDVRGAYDRSLAFLSNLDAIQVDNLASNIIHNITDPNVAQAMRRQIYEEEIHVESYGTIIETVVPDPERIYDMYNVMPQLENKNSAIVEVGKRLRTVGFSPEAFYLACVANVALEGIYFYLGFKTFYNIVRTLKLMGETVDQIKYINRDEICHLKLFTLMMQQMRIDFPGIENKPEVIEGAKQILIDAADHEIAWGKVLIPKSGFLGSTWQGNEAYVKYLTNKRSIEAGVGDISKELGITHVGNPYPWVESYELVNKRQSNFFERKVDTYSDKSLVFSRHR